MDDAVAGGHLRAVTCEWGLSITLAAKIKTTSALVRILATTLVKAQWLATTPWHNLTFNDFSTRKTLCFNILQWTNTILPSTDHGTLLPLFQPLLYLQALITLTCIFHIPNTSHIQTWKNRFLQINITPKTYTAAHHKHLFVTYVKIDLQQQKTYIGETYKGISERELTRRRKLKQLHNDRNASCELALHYWHNTKTYHNYSTIVTHKMHNAPNYKNYQT